MSAETLLPRLDGAHQQQRDDVVQKRVAEAPRLYRAVMANAFSGDCSPRAAIKAQCLMCVGYERPAITACTGYSCPLWSFRPYQYEGGCGSRNDAADAQGGQGV